MKSSPISRRAFTLIELLVVIAIIAILAAILFPVFAQAKQAAKKTQSLSNAKNQITGVIMYAGDTDDTFTFSEAGCEPERTQVQWYATVLPYIKNGKSYRNATTGATEAYGEEGIWSDPSHPQGQGQQYGLNRDLFPANYCIRQGDLTPDGNQAWTPSISATSVENPADKVAVMNKNKNGTQPYNWSYPYFAAEEWMWTARFRRVSGAVVSDGSEIMSGLAPRDWGYVMNKDCGGTDQFEECGASVAYRYNGQALAAYVDGHAKSVAKGRLKWFENIAHNTGTRWWGPNTPWYPYNGF